MTSSMAPHITVVITSLNPASRSAIMARSAYSFLHSGGISSELIDLAEWTLPICDGESCYQNENVLRLTGLVKRATGILVASPIYNFDLNAAAKNLLELTGDAWSDKIVGFLCAAGGQGSYMSTMAFANSLMLDYRCLIIPRSVFATGGAFANGIIDDSEVTNRIEELAAEITRLCRALAGDSG